MDFLPSATTWIDLEGVSLREVSQKDKAKYLMVPFTSGISR